MKMYVRRGGCRGWFDNTYGDNLAVYFYSTEKQRDTHPNEWIFNVTTTIAKRLGVKLDINQKGECDLSAKDLVTL